MSEILINDIFDDLKHENNRLLNDLIISQKRNQLLEKYRNYLLYLSNNCKCNLNIGNKNIINLLEIEYKSVFNNNNEEQVENNFTISTKKKNKLKIISIENPSKKCKISDNFEKHIKSVNNEKQLMINNIEDNERLNESNNDLSEESDNEINYDLNEDSVKQKKEKRLTKENLLEKINAKEVEEEIDDKNMLIKVFRKKYFNESLNKWFVNTLGFGCNWNECHYINGRKFHVIEHIRYKHTFEMPFACDKCDYKTYGKNNLNYHKNNYHSLFVTKFKCDWNDCKYETKTKYNLEEHQNRHKGIKPFACVWPSCESSFCTSNELKRHESHHGISRPHSCQWPGCEAKFKTRCELSSHNIIHTGAKRFGCDWPECEAKFKDNWHLNRHKMVHLKQKT